MKTFLLELRQRNELLFYFGSLCLLLSIIFLLLTILTSVKVMGINAWYKPFKFALSIAVYSWTMAWLIHYLPSFNAKLFAWTVVGLLGFEILYIALQAGRGQLSHFNVSTTWYIGLYMVMAVAATAVTIYTAYIGVLFFKGAFPQLERHYLWSIRLGIWLFVIFAFQGFLMGSRLSHTVGGADGSIGLPLLNWSLSYGDLRIAHFIGMHALQVLPILSFYVLRSTQLTILSGFIYTVLAASTLWIALQGKPLFPKKAQQPAMTIKNTTA